jgi:tetratricopeptide (TPR) repeat protein
MKRITLFIIYVHIFLLIYSSSSFAQAIDSLQIAQKYARNGEYQKAETLLVTFNQYHQNPYSRQLHAQILYWLGKKESSVALLKKSIEIFPSNHFLKLDLGRILYESGNYAEAKIVLDTLLSYDSMNAEGNIMLVYLLVWKGDNHKAKLLIQKLKDTYPDNKEIAAIFGNIKNDFSDELLLRFNNVSDDQPILSNQFGFTYKKKYSALFAPSIEIMKSNFTGVATPTLWVKTNDQINVSFGKTKVLAGIGWFNAQKSFSGLTHELSLEQKLSSSTKFLASSEKIPYQYTTSSIISPLLYGLQKMTIQVDKRKLIGAAGIERQSFADNNAVFTAYTWGLISVIQITGISLMGGYGFSYANTDDSKYTASKSLLSIVASQPLNSIVDGIYSPYFTPLKQQVHSLLANLTVKPSNTVSIKLNGSYGIMAQALAPYLVLEKNTVNKYFINSYSTPYNYTPVNIECSIQAMPTKNIHIEAGYQNSRLFFYTRNMLNIHLRFLL